MQLIEAFCATRGRSSLNASALCRAVETVPRLDVTACTLRPRSCPHGVCLCPQEGDEEEEEEDEEDEGKHDEL